MARDVNVDLDAAFSQLQSLYDEIDQRIDTTTKSLKLPCHKGCSMCCHHSVFITPLEFFYAWDYVQKTHGQSLRDAIVQKGLSLYDKFKVQIAALDQRSVTDQNDHTALARSINFACPLLDDAGACLAYPQRELLARLFGASFNDERGLYACSLVSEHLKKTIGDRPITLMQARPTARRLNTLPLTGKRQVYPYYFNLLYGSTSQP